MPSFAIVLAAAAINAAVAQGAIAQGATAEGRIRLAQTSTVTNCMMTCNALGFLQAIYRDRQVQLPVRMRAAIEALPFESPKLSATAVFPAGEDFAAMLDRAIQGSQGNGRNVPQIELSAEPEPSNDELGAN
jgi:hypothetical protein